MKVDVDYTTQLTGQFFSSISLYNEPFKPRIKYSYLISVDVSHLDIFKDINFIFNNYSLLNPKINSLNLNAKYFNLTHKISKHTITGNIFYSHKANIQFFHFYTCKLQQYEKAKTLEEIRLLTQMLYFN